MFRFFLIFLLFLSLISCNLNVKNPGKDIRKDSGAESLDPKKAMKLVVSNSEEYNQVLDQLNTKDLQSIDLAIRIFQNAKADSLSRDSMMVGFNDFFGLITGTYLENNDSLQGRKGIDISEEATKKLKERLSVYGMILTTAEGEFYLEPDNNFLLQNFGNKITSAYREFLSISAHDQKQKFADDGAILIPADSLAARIVTWEDFMDKYPSFVSLNKVQEFYSQYMEAYLSGTDNTKAFDPATNKLRDDLRQSFEYYLKQNPGRKSTSVIKGYYDLLKSAGFGYSEKVDCYILEKLYE